MRKGYNSDWQWKQWSAEVKACADAIKAGDLGLAAWRLEKAEQLDEQLLLFEDEQAAGEE